MFHCIYYIIYGYTNDKIISEYCVPLLLNVVYIKLFFLNWFFNMFDLLKPHVFGMLIGFYTFDTSRQILSDDKDKYVYIFHHIATLHLLMLHIWGILPLQIGFFLLTIFEFSNTFLIPYQLCLYKNWRSIRYKLSHPMAFTYVPLRLFGIPFCTSLYIPYINKLSSIKIISSIIPLAFLNIFSIYYAVYIGYRYVLWILKKRT